MEEVHHYRLLVRWTGNTGSGTSAYTAYDRSHEIHIPGKPVITGSSDPAFRGNPAAHNPEEMLLSALSACHMLWYLHLCAEAGVVVTGYSDEASAVMEETPSGGRFREAMLRPRVTVRDAGMAETAMQLHKKANALCYIANSVRFPVLHEAVID